MSEGMRRPLRIIHDGAHDGPTNMARDEALLALVGEGKSPPTLRTYLWSPPTISLGYFQKYADYERLDPPAGELPVVRRQTGGGAILHDRELTYSITLPASHPLLADGPNTLSEVAHDALRECLGDRSSALPAGSGSMSFSEKASWPAAPNGERGRPSSNMGRSCSTSGTASNRRPQSARRRPWAPTTCADRSPTPSPDAAA